MHGDDQDAGTGSGLGPGPAVRIGSWSELGGAATAVRQAVFVREQGIALELELDARDADAVHAVAFSASGEPLATGRLLPDAHIGRMAVLREHRQTGLGARILGALVAEAVRRGERRLRLHAQTSAVGFYERHGFAAVGECYEEAGILHRTMERTLGDLTLEGLR